MSQKFLLNINGKPYKPARYVHGKKGKQVYIEYWMYHVEKGKAVRRRFYQIKGSTAAKKREHAKYLVQQINKMLHEGYIFGKEIPDVQLTGVKVPLLLDAFQQIVNLKQVQNSKRSAEAYRSFLNVFTAWCKKAGKNILVTRFTKADVMHYLDWLVTERKYRGRTGVSNVTRNNHLVLIHSIFQDLTERQIIEKNPANGIKRLKEEGKKYIAFSDRQKEILTAHLLEHDYNLYVFTQFIYYCFIRPAELLRLKVKHIDLANRVITIPAPDSKNSKQASAVIPKPLMPYIEQMQLSSYPPEYFIFSKPRLRPGPIPQVRTRVSERHTKALKACGLYNGELSMYGWKHTGNKNAYLAGVDIKTIQAQNRHSSLELTDIYLRSLGVRIEKDLLDKEW